MPALRELAKEVRKKPVSLFGTLLLAVSLRKQNAERDTFELLRVARGQYPAEFWVHVALSDMLYESYRASPTKLADRLPEAIAGYRVALALRPNLAVLWSNFGVALTEKNEHDEALAAFQRAIDLDPGNAARVYTNLGNTLKVCSDLDSALATLNEHGQLDAIIETLLKVVVANPKDGKARAILGHAYRERAQYQLALEQWKTACQHSPNDPTPLRELGNIYLKIGRSDEALDAYRKALALQP